MTEYQPDSEAAFAEEKQAALRDMVEEGWLEYEEEFDVLSVMVGVDFTPGSVRRGVGIG